MQLKKAPAPTLTENGKAASESNGAPPKKTKPQRIVGVHSVGHYTLWFHAQSAQIKTSKNVKKRPKTRKNDEKIAQSVLHRRDSARKIWS